ncbi:Methyltransferase domain [Geoglobus ahangari]|uniref:Arsenite methyltransferase n=1 Tax=Geoglobus ahangari TaxID=113653 RepID=A0A0F7IED6_9EURY|nr:methyltransferase domain-containing protein [Geoglobus ahangari]AKG90737.1 Methyltransferase domain [Geoglobus ahangari]
MIQIQKNTLDKFMDFFYGYLILKSYIFKLRLLEEYPNRDYLEKWESYLSDVDFGTLLENACSYMKEEVDGRILDIADAMERASYYALIHPQHPNITLGFVKDADLWNLWLEYGIYRYARELILEVADIGAGDKVVDLGCGSASPAFYSEAVGSSGYYVGVDYSKPLLKIAEKNCEERGLKDRVRLNQGYADSKMDFSRKYDVVILSSILEYSDPKSVLRNAINAVGSSGRIVVFSELFTDLQPERVRLFDLYYSLIPNFRGFLSVGEITLELDRLGVLYTVKGYGNHVMVIEVGE